jgi:hypothetical protein
VAPDWLAFTARGSSPICAMWALSGRSGAGVMMSDREATIARIHAAFGNNTYPGGGYLQGSFDGCEPYEQVSPFATREYWKGLEASFLDAHADALNFFSEAGFRFFLPAYLIADLRGHLSVADPLFQLTHGFSDRTTEIPANCRTFVMRYGKSAFLNPRRYGATTFYEYARYRLSVITREEASAMVAYLKFKCDLGPDVFDREAIEAAPDLFWLEREQKAPPAANLEQHIAEQEEYLAAIRSGIKDGT